jgi:hypothetical protein
MNTLTPQEAIETLDRAVGMLNATRQDHFALQQAIISIRRFIAENTTGTTTKVLPFDPGNATATKSEA